MNGGSEISTGFEIFVFILSMIIAIFPPAAFVNEGLTVESLFNFYIGPAAADPIGHNCRKIVVRRASIGCFPFVFFLAMQLFYDPTIFAVIPTNIAQCVSLASIFGFVGSLSYAYYHHHTRFEQLEPIKNLKKYSPNIDEMKARIAVEYVNFDNYTSALSAYCHLVISDSWFMHFDRFTFHIVNSADVQFTVVHCSNFKSSIDGGERQNYTIRAKAGSIDIPDFHFRTRVDVARDVILHQSTDELFENVFRDEIVQNGNHPIGDPDSLEECIGCYQRPADVKISKACPPSQDRQPCRDCFCPPRWCASCLARVFMAKQAAAQIPKERWMSGQADCPTCRATFCVLDVHFLAIPGQD
ncbi:unnamed protein product, partial [Mesorhabditis spiculigera]